MAAHSSSSISSSDLPDFSPRCEPGLTQRRVIAACMLALAGLVIVDVAISRLFRMPLAPSTPPSALQQYFDYGRSVESKLRRMVGPTGDDTAPIAKAGWLNDQTRGVREPSPGKIHIALYGQSFAEHMVEAMQAMDDRFQIIAERSGPAAPLSHSYAAYRADSGKPAADIAIIGILASALPKVLSLTNMTTSFEAPAPFTYPRFRLEGRALTTVEPRVRTLADLRRALKEPAGWSEFTGQLRQDDLAFDSLLFEADAFDHSSLARLARRSYGQYRLQRLSERYHTSSGFKNNDGLLDVSKAMLGDIARIARERRQLAYVVLIQDRGYGSDLATALGPFLEQEGIPYLSTHTLGPPTDTRTYVADGHFRSDINEKLAQALRDDLLARWSGRSPSPVQ